ncbi:MAG: DUF448 domain-containing protein [Polyangiaceae bacterium]|nr:DUF448 domain-containing protein [Polyangiaceae bacterium]
MRHARSRGEPERTCAGCRARGGAGALVRVVLDAEGGVVVDLAGGAFGRGAWLHPTPACLRKAAAGGLSRSLRATVRTSPGELAGRLGVAASRRAAGLLTAARRSGSLAAGAAAVRDALAAGRGRLVVVATDARAAASTSGVEAAVSRGEAFGWGTKASLGALTGREEVGVLAVLDARIATALASALAIVQMAETISRTAPVGGATEDG